MQTVSYSPVVQAPSLTLDNDELARDYENVSATRQFEVGKRLAAELRIAPGERVLDIGCGTGLLANHLADLVGADGAVVGIDPLPSRLEVAQEKKRANLSFMVANAYDLKDLTSGSFDVVVMNSVFHWLPEKTRPLLECARLLRAGGRVGIATALKGSHTGFHDIAVKVFSEPPFNRHPRPRRSLTYRVDAEELRALFLMTGFAPKHIEVRDTERLHPSPAALVNFAEASSFGNFLAHLPLPLHGQARDVLRRRLWPLVTSDGIVQRSRRLFAVATRA